MLARFSVTGCSALDPQVRRRLVERLVAPTPHGQDAYCLGLQVDLGPPGP